MVAKSKGGKAPAVPAKGGKKAPPEAPAKSMKGKGAKKGC
jgi:hypothetical protein